MNVFSDQLGRGSGNPNATNLAVEAWFLSLNGSAGRKRATTAWLPVPATPRILEPNRRDPKSLLGSSFDVKAALEAALPKLMMAALIGMGLTAVCYGFGLLLDLVQHWPALNSHVAPITG
jgi:hypothetical protein